MNRCQNCGHDTTEYDPYELLEQMISMYDGGPTRALPDVLDRARACVRNNPMVQLALPSGHSFGDMIRLPVAKYLEFRRLGFDELRAPVWTTKEGEQQLLEIVKRAERMRLPAITEGEKHWLADMLNKHATHKALSNLRHLLRRR